jgi:CcmD family protein
MPSIALHTAVKYVAGAYTVVFVIVLIYVAIMALRLSRNERELGDLIATLRARESAGPAEPLGRPLAEGVDEDEDAAPEAPQVAAPASP